MDIVLSKSEKRSFYNFMALYLGSSFILIILIAILYYISMESSLLQNKKHKMKNHALNIASKVIYAHMNNKKFKYKDFGTCDIGLYSKDKKLLFGKNIEGIDFTKEEYIKGKKLYIIDRSSQLHLGVKYIVLKDIELYQLQKNLQKRVIFFTLVTLILIGFIGHFLGKLFLRPIISERKKLDRFLKDITHELNTPISALVMSTSSLDEKHSKIAGRIHLSATRISNLYGDLCYLVMNDLQKQDTIKKIDIKKVIEEQIILLEEYAASKKISIKLDIESFFYDIDEESAKRLISNLLSNALKYSKPQKDIFISLKNRVLLIEDSGIGIKQKQIENIKKRYFRVDETQSGFGIGLNIVDMVCRKYHIEFFIESKYGVGTSVKLIFQL